LKDINKYRTLKQGTFFLVSLLMSSSSGILCKVTSYRCFEHQLTYVAFYLPLFEHRSRDVGHDFSWRQIVVIALGS